MENWVVRTSFCGMPDSASALRMAAMILELAAVASWTVLPRVVTPLRIWARSGATLTLASPVTTTRATDGRCCARAPSSAAHAPRPIASAARHQLDRRLDSLLRMLLPDLPPG